MGNKVGNDMAKQVKNRLDDRTIKSAIKNGLRVINDGKGLRLAIKPTGSASWVLRAAKNGKEYNIGLGDYPSMSLDKARRLADETRNQIKEGKDPLAAKQEKNAIPTFQEAATQYHRQKVEPIRSVKYSKQWLHDFKRLVFPHIGRIRIDSLNTHLVVTCVDKIWKETHVTAKRVLQRIIAVADYADYPLNKGAVVKKLANIDHKPKNHPAMPYGELGAFMDVLRNKQTMAAFALEALILTAARSGEIRGARWSEIDTDKKIWTVPAERMKAKAEHIVPLSPQALAAFEKAKQLTTAKEPDLVFESIQSGKQLSDMTLSKAMRDWGYEYAPHGFRSSFRDWIGNETMFDGELAEMALAHTIKNAAERAYRRGNMLEKRRAMMNAWADYCDGKTDLGENVIQFKAV